MGRRPQHRRIQHSSSDNDSPKMTRTLQEQRPQASRVITCITIRPHWATDATFGPHKYLSSDSSRSLIDSLTDAQQLHNCGPFTTYTMMMIAEIGREINYNRILVQPKPNPKTRVHDHEDARHRPIILLSSAHGPPPMPSPNKTEDNKSNA